MKQDVEQLRKDPDAFAEFVGRTRLTPMQQQIAKAILSSRVTIVLARRPGKGSLMNVLYPAK